MFIVCQNTASPIGCPTASRSAGNLVFDLGAHDRQPYNADVFSSMGSLISLAVSVDVKHHVYLLTYFLTAMGLRGVQLGASA